MKRLGALFLALIVTGLAPVAAQRLGDPRFGERIAEEQCSECHAVSAKEVIIFNLEAPHFVDIANTPALTEGALRVWLRSSHPTMPNIMLTTEQTDDIVEYILSLKEK